MTANAVRITHGIHVTPNADSTFSLKGKIMVLFRYSLISDPLVKKSTNMITSRHMKSMVRSSTTVPTS